MDAAHMTIPVFTNERCYYCSGPMIRMFERDVGSGSSKYMDCKSCKLRVHYDANDLQWVLFWVHGGYLVLRLDYANNKTLLYDSLSSRRLTNGYDYIMNLDYVLDDIVPSNIASRIEKWLLLI